jgi:polyribonucleotide nucleotidyltransferase
MKTLKMQIPFGDEHLFLESGKLATLSNGSITLRYGDTVILVTAVVSKEPREGVDFFPLTVDYEERLYAAGKISGSRFVKREGRPTDAAILTARLVDRSIRPLFPKEFRRDIQVIITVLSYDGEHDPAIAAIVGASSALMQTNAPFKGPIAASRVGYIDGQFVLNPTVSQMENSTLDLVVSGSKEKVLMLEAGANQLDDKLIEEAIEFGKQGYIQAIESQTSLAEGVDKITVEKTEDDPIVKEIKNLLDHKLTEAIRQTDKQIREDLISALESELIEKLSENYEEAQIKKTLNKLIEKEVRRAILEESVRPDGRAITQIRPISSEVSLLPRVHGSGLFTRGQTQVLTIATLGAPGEEQIIETMEEEGTKRYMHHYNFPPFSTGEVRPMRGVSRREIGHGALAERALIPVLPTREDFPYTIRLVSEVLSSNGSSSMAATCGSTLALMDAGVPITSPVAGIAIGLMTGEVNGKEIYKILTDIQGIEDFAGDMDFKITGTKNGVTAIQLDVKNDGLTKQMVAESLAAAKQARLQILENILQTISAPRAELSQYAPRIYTITINPDKIGELIGPGGKVINKIIADAGGKELVSIDIEDDGTVMVSSTKPEAAQIALSMINGITREVQIGEIFTGPVTQIIKDRNTGKEIGAIVQILPNQEGMVHISQISEQRIANVSDALKVGDIIPVKVMEIDKERGRMSLSHKAAKQITNSEE